MDMQSMIVNKFKERGFTANQLGKAIFVHELLGILMLALTWGGCYQWPPSQHPILKEPVSRMLAAVPSGVSNVFQGNGFLSSRLGSAYIESSCCRKLIRPLTLPGKMFVTFKVVEAWTKSDKSVIPSQLGDKNDKKSTKNNKKAKAASSFAFLVPFISFSSDGGSLPNDTTLLF